MFAVKLNEIDENEKTKVKDKEKSMLFEFKFKSLADACLFSGAGSSFGLGWLNLNSLVDSNLDSSEQKQFTFKVCVQDLPVHLLVWYIFVASNFVTVTSHSPEISSDLVVEPY